MSTEQNTSETTPQPEVEQNTTTPEAIDTTAQPDNLAEEPAIEPTVEEKLGEMHDKYIRLYSEFDNFRKRTAKERIELAATANAETVKAILPVLDDFERALKSIDTTQDIAALREGVDLIYNKLKNTLVNKGLAEMDSLHQPFDADIHEAITQIPAPTDDLKGKVVDQVEKGYTLHGKVIRYAKVVVGQ